MTETTIIINVVISTIAGLSGLILVLFADPLGRKPKVYWISGFILLIISILLLTITVWRTI